MSCRHIRGFTCSHIRGLTLVEVLIALVVIALALTALLGVAQREAHRSGALRDTALAQWVAADALAEWRAGGEPIAAGRRSGTAQQAGRQFRWEMVTVQSPAAGILRIDLRVESDDAAAPVAATLTTFAAAESF